MNEKRPTCETVHSCSTNVNTMFATTPGRRRTPGRKNVAKRRTGSKKTNAVTGSRVQQLRRRRYRANEQQERDLNNSISSVGASRDVNLSTEIAPFADTRRQATPPKRPRRLRVREVIESKENEYVVERCGLLPRRLADALASNMDESIENASAKVDSSGWAVAIESGRIFVWHLNFDAVSTSNPLEHPTKTYILDFPAPIHPHNAVDRVSLVLGQSSAECPGVVAVSASGLVRYWPSADGKEVRECRAIPSSEEMYSSRTSLSSSPETCSSIHTYRRLRSFLVSTSRGRLIRIQVSSGGMSVEGELTSRETSSSASTLLGRLSGVLGLEQSQSMSSPFLASSSRVTRTLVVSSEPDALYVLRFGNTPRDLMLESFDLPSHKFMFDWPLGQQLDDSNRTLRQCCAFDSSSLLLLTINNVTKRFETLLLNMRSSGPRIATQCCVDLGPGDPRVDSVSIVAAHPIFYALRTHKRSAGRQTFVTVATPTRILTELRRPIAATLGVGEAFHGLCILDVSDDIAVLITPVISSAPRNTASASSRASDNLVATLLLDESLSDAADVSSRLCQESSRNGFAACVKRASLLILGNDEGDEEKEEDVTSENDAGDSTYLKDLQGHHPELVQHRLTKKRARHERMLARLRDANLWHALQASVRESLADHGEMLRLAEAIGSILNKGAAHRHTLLEAMSRSCKADKSAIVQDVFFTNIARSIEMFMSFLVEAADVDCKKRPIEERTDVVKYVNSALRFARNAVLSYDRSRYVDSSSKSRWFPDRLDDALRQQIDKILAHVQALDNVSSQAPPRHRREDVLLRVRRDFLVDLAVVMEMLLPNSSLKRLDACMRYLVEGSAGDAELETTTLNLAIRFEHVISVAHLLQDRPRDLSRALGKARATGSHLKLAHATFDRFCETDRLKDLIDSVVFDSEMWSEIWPYVSTKRPEVAWIVALEAFGDYDEGTTSLSDEHVGTMPPRAIESVEIAMKSDDVRDVRTKRLLLSVGRLMEMLTPSGNIDSSPRFRDALQREIRPQESLPRDRGGDDSSAPLDPRRIIECILGSQDGQCAHGLLRALKIYRKTVRDTDAIPEAWMRIRERIWSGLFGLNLDLWANAESERRSAKISDKDLGRKISNSGLFAGVRLCPDGHGALTEDLLKKLCEKSKIESSKVVSIAVQYALRQSR